MVVQKLRRTTFPNRGVGKSFRVVPLAFNVDGFFLVCGWQKSCRGQKAVMTNAPAKNCARRWVATRRNIAQKAETGNYVVNWYRSGEERWGNIDKHVRRTLKQKNHVKVGRYKGEVDDYDARFSSAGCIHRGRGACKARGPALMADA